MMPVSHLLRSVCLAALMAAGTYAVPKDAAAQSLQGPGTLGGNTSVAAGVSANGLVVVGSAESALFNTEAFRWTQGTGMVGLGTLGGNASQANEISADGSVIVGYARNASSNNEAFHWTQDTGMVGLGALGGDTSRAWGVNGDGSVVIGDAENAFGNSEAFRWTQATGMVSLGTLGGTYSGARDISLDGSVIIGNSENTSFDYEAFRWTSGTGMVGLGTLGGDTSYGSAVNSDGSVITGFAHNASNYFEAYRWSEDTGMVGLGTLSGNNSYANAISADGSVIVGVSEAPSFTSQAFHWTEETGMQSLYQILSDADVDLTDWQLENYSEANGVSADGSVIVGVSQYMGRSRAFIVNLAAGGIATPEQIAQDTAPIAQNAIDAQYHMMRSNSDSLQIARNALPIYLGASSAAPLAGSSASYGGTDAAFMPTDAAGFANLDPAAGPSAASPVWRRKTALFAFGTVGIGQENNFSNQGYNGVSGILFEISPAFALGVGALGSYNNFETRLGGDTRTTSFGGTLLGSYESTTTPWRAYASASIVSVDARFNRNYVNGGGVDTSRGNTDGFGYGVSGRVGYEKPINEEFGFMPYGELQYAHTKLNAYTETGGGFPATIGEQESDTIVSKFGGELSYKASPDTTWRFRGAWAHQYGDTATDVNVTVAGIGQNIAGVGGDRDWVEMGASIHHNATDRLLLTGDVTGRTGERSEPAIAGTVGVIWYLN